MVRTSLSEQDISEIRNLEGKMPISRIRAKYNIGSKKIYEIWDAPAKLAIEAPNAKEVPPPTNLEPRTIEAPPINVEPVKEVPATLWREVIEMGKGLLEEIRKNRDRMQQIEEKLEDEKLLKQIQEENENEWENNNNENENEEENNDNENENKEENNNFIPPLAVGMVLGAFTLKLYNYSKKPPTRMGPPPQKYFHIDRGGVKHEVTKESHDFWEKNSMGKTPPGKYYNKHNTLQDYAGNYYIDRPTWK